MNPQPDNIIEMPKPVKKFVPPTIEECKARAQEKGLPDVEAEKFFCYYGSKGWLVGKTPMKNWHLAMAGWKLRYDQRTHGVRHNGAQTVVWNDEYKRVDQRIQTIKSSYGDHQSWREQDRDEFRRLVARKNELKKLLGVEE